MPLELLDMSGTAGEEHASLYMRGVNEAASGAELEAQKIRTEVRHSQESRRSAVGQEAAGRRILVTLPFYQP
jgi:hypothetical protein